MKKKQSNHGSLGLSASHLDLFKSFVDKVSEYLNSHQATCEQESGENKKASSSNVTMFQMEGGNTTFFSGVILI